VAVRIQKATLADQHIRDKDLLAEMVHPIMLHTTTAAEAGVQVLRVPMEQLVLAQEAEEQILQYQAPI
jgi:hypothetical protein